MDIAVRDGRIVGVRGRAADRVNRGRLDPKDLYGWQANTPPTGSPGRWSASGGELVETDWDTAMDRIVDAVPRAAGRAGRVGALRLLHHRPAVPRGVLHARGASARRASARPHMDGNTRLCTATAAAALKASFGTDGQPGSLRRRRPLRRDRALGPQRRRDPDGAVDADARPRARLRPTAPCSPSTHGATPVAARGRRPPRRPRRHQPGADQRARCASSSSAAGSTSSTSTRTRSASTICARRRWVHARLDRGDLRRSSAADIERGRRADRHWRTGCSPPCCRASTSPTRPPRRPARSTTSTCSAG